MPLGTQMKLLRTMRGLLLGNGTDALTGGQGHKAICPPVAAWPPYHQYLSRSTPEKEGVPSALLEKLYRDVAAAPDANPHCLLVLKNGRLVSEGYFSPFRRDVWHVTHSLCKSFTGTAVGLAIQEGLFGLDDPVAKYFRDKLPLLPSRQLQSITVRHLLTMTSGISFNEISEAVETEWLRGIFNSPLGFAPGSRFVYNSMNSYLLAALVCRTAGMSLSDYLEARLFKPLGFGPVCWETSPESIEKGGWGMYVLPEDMAKLGQLYLQKGRWQTATGEKQILSAEWVEQATRTHVVGPAGEQYGFQLWTEGKEEAFIFNGMFGQYVAVLPRHSMVVVMTAGNSRLFTDSPAYDLLRNCFYPLPSLQSPLPANPAALASLDATLASLRFRLAPRAKEHRPGVKLPAGRPRGWNAPRTLLQADAGNRAAALALFCDVSWHFQNNRVGLMPVVIQAMDNNFSTGLEQFSLAMKDPETLLLRWSENGQALVLKLGLRCPVEETLGFGEERFLVAGSADIQPDENNEPVLKIELCFLEHSSCRTLNLRRRGDELLLLAGELPHFALAIDSALRQNTATTSGGNPQSASPLSSLTGRLKDNDYLHYRIEQLCTPSLVGKPEAAEG